MRSFALKIAAIAALFPRNALAHNGVHHAQGSEQTWYANPHAIDAFIVVIGIIVFAALVFRAERKRIAQEK